MLVPRRRGWEIPESEATPEAAYLSRRAIIAGGAGLIGGTLLGGAGAPRNTPTRPSTCIRPSATGATRSTAT